MLKSASLPLAIGGGGMILALGGAHIVSGEPVELITAVGTTAKYIAIYFPVLFLLEEVAFRGALDAHVHHDGEGRGWQSALFVSSLWGLWHLPITEGMTFPVAVAVVLVVHIVLGVPLSFAWRRTRNLSGVAFAHATIDAMRNALAVGL
jgi:membrane protease YdiL (CAAX protease family)